MYCKFICARASLICLQHSLEVNILIMWRLHQLSFIFSINVVKAIFLGMKPFFLGFSFLFFFGRYNKLLFKCFQSVFKRLTFLSVLEEIHMDSIQSSTNEPTVNIWGLFWLFGFLWNSPKKTKIYQTCKFVNSWKETSDERKHTKLGRWLITHFISLIFIPYWRWWNKIYYNGIDVTIMSSYYSIHHHY